MADALDVALVSLWVSSGLDASYPLRADEILEDDSGTPDLPYAVFTIVSNVPTCFTSESQFDEMLLQIKVFCEDSASESAKDLAADAMGSIEAVIDNATLTLQAGEGHILMCRPSMGPVPWKESNFVYSYTKRWRVIRRKES